LQTLCLQVRLQQALQNGKLVVVKAASVDCRVRHQHLHAGLAISTLLQARLQTGGTVAAHRLLDHDHPPSAGQPRQQVLGALENKAPAKMAEHHQNGQAWGAATGQYMGRAHLAPLATPLW